MEPAASHAIAPPRGDDLPPAQRVPAALQAALAVAVVGTLAVWLGWLYVELATSRPADPRAPALAPLRWRLGLGSTAGVVTVGALFGVGLAQLAARRDADRARLALRVAAAGMALWLASYLAWLYATYAWRPSLAQVRAGTLARIFNVTYLVQEAAVTTTAAALVVAGWRHRAVRRLAAPAALLVLASWPPPPLFRWLYAHVHGDGAALHPWRWLLLQDGGRLALAGLLAVAIVAIARASPPSPPRWRRAGRALHDVGRARLAVAGVVMLAVATQLLTSSDPQAPVASVWTQWGPAALVVLQVVVAVGLIRTAGLVDRAVPARRLVAAAALLLWTATLEAIKIAATYRALHPVGADYPTSGAEIGPILDAFAWLAPVALLAADLLLLWSLAALTARVRSAETPATLRQAATAVALLRGVVIVVGALDLRRLAVHGRQAELAVVMVVFALAAVSVEVIAANACRQVAAGLDAEAAPARAPAV